ncbi:MAG: DUF6772 family protein [Alphaproteobacteria bacterium]
MDPVQKALFRADPDLSRFDPLPRILFFDRFNRGYHGWTALVGNYENDIDTMHPGYRQITAPMLSNLSHWDCGTHGAMSGTYALKIATRAKAAAQSVAIKRITFQRACPIKLEFYFTFKPEASTLKLSKTDLRSVGLLFDLQDDTNRVMPHLRYLNAHGDRLVQRWQYKDKAVDFERLSDETATHYHLADQDWVDLPGEAQELCYNEIPTKVNWHYAAVGFDLATMRYTHFQCNDRIYDMSGVGSLTLDAMPNLRGMLNVAFFAEANTDKRTFFYLDSVILSGEWD